MAVTNQKSTQLNIIDGGGAAGVRVESSEVNERTMVVRWSFTQQGVGDPGSTVDIWRVKSGSRLLSTVSDVQNSAYGAGVTYDLGWPAYTEPDGTPVAADPDGIAAAIDGNTTTRKVIADVTGAPRDVLFQGDALIQATINGGAGIPDAATMTGLFFIMLP